MLDVGTGASVRIPWSSIQLERQLRARLDALGPAPRAELLHVLPDFERVGLIQSYWGNPGDSLLRRAPDRLRGRIGRCERCWSGCCGSQTASPQTPNTYAAGRLLRFCFFSWPQPLNEIAYLVTPLLAQLNRRPSVASAHKVRREDDLAIHNLR